MDGFLGIRIKEFIEDRIIKPCLNDYKDNIYFQKMHITPLLLNSIFDYKYHYDQQLLLEIFNETMKDFFTINFELPDELGTYNGFEDVFYSLVDKDKGYQLTKKYWKAVYPLLQNDYKFYFCKKDYFLPNNLELEFDISSMIYIFACKINGNVNHELASEILNASSKNKDIDISNISDVPESLLEENLLFTSFIMKDVTTESVLSPEKDLLTLFDIENLRRILEINNEKKLSKAFITLERQTAVNRLKELINIYPIIRIASVTPVENIYYYVSKNFDYFNYIYLTSILNVLYHAKKYNYDDGIKRLLKLVSDVFNLYLCSKYYNNFDILFYNGVIIFYSDSIETIETNFTRIKQDKIFSLSKVKTINIKH